ncbi:MAG TPA: hypothetical protein VEF03_08075 [Candidatus Binataceae bacterium]|nr:hypothetical protein [Candidatus Binataceae bacterium]
MKAISKITCLLLLAAVGGCAQSNPPPASTSAVSAAPAIASPGQGACNLDIKKLCEAYFGRSDFLINGTEYNAQRLQQNGRAHENVDLHLKYADGSPITAIECQIETQHQAITYAHFVSGSTFDDRAQAYAKEQGFCDPSADYSKLLTDTQLGKSIDAGL